MGWNRRAWCGQNRARKFATHSARSRLEAHPFLLSRGDVPLVCTLTIIPLGKRVRSDRGATPVSGIRLACNRDESRLRPPALPPELRQFGNRLAVLPIDPVSDGTWIAASDAGLVFVLM